jgi:hypothetical protein
MDIEQKFGKRCVKQKGNEKAVKNSPKKLFETDYFLVTVDWALMALTI